MTRHAFVDHRNRMCFFVSPKCGSSSLFTWLMTTALGQESDRRKDRLVPEVFGYGFATAAHLAREHGYFSVGLIRHPALRAASAFNDKVVGHTENGAKIYRKHHGIADGADSGFPGYSFNGLLDELSDLFARGRHERVYRHFRPQVHHKHEEFGLVFDRVCPVETLSDDFEPVNRFYGGAQPFARTNTRSRRAGPTGIADLADRMSAELRDLDYHPRDLLTGETLEKLARLYAIDYRIFGYDPMDLDAPPRLRAGNRDPAGHKSLEDFVRSENRDGGLGRWLGRFRR